VPLVADATPYTEVVRAVQRTSNFAGYDIVAIEEPWLNANSTAFFAAKNRLDTGVRSYYTSLGYAQKDSSAAMQRIDEFSTRFVITLDAPFQAPPNFLNVVSQSVLQELKNPEHFAPVPFSSEKGILIFERRASGGLRP
jgi:hypothetical protein